jgi:hypothetical protein
MRWSGHHSSVIEVAFLNKARIGCEGKSFMSNCIKLQNSQSCLTLSFSQPAPIKQNNHGWKGGNPESKKAF